MPQVLIRGLSTETIDRLKARAQAKGRSLQAELREVLERSAESDWEAADAALARAEAAVGGHVFTDSTLLIREDRNR